MRLILLISLCLIVCIGRQGLCAEAKGNPSDDATTTVPLAEFEAMKAKLEELQREMEELKKAVGPQPAATPVEEGAQPTPVPEPAAQGGGRALALPDISLIVQAKGKLSSDKRDDGRNRVRLCEAELAVQGYVYPNVKADAFIAMSPAEDAAAQAEEAYLTYLGLSKGLNLAVGKRLVGFGRTNQTHCHSLLYTRRPLVLRNLVGEEGLAGQGLEASYLLPTTGDLFAELDMGTWTGEGPGETSDLPDVMAGPGANFADRFTTARLWTSYPVQANAELELGSSYAKGEAGELNGVSGGRAQLTGLDLTYRRFGEGTSRLLLRGEGIWRHQTDDVSGGSTATGYYLFGNWRNTKYASLGVLYDWSEFPQAPGLHESAVSLIWTKQFSEQYYLRLQGTHGSRPGDDSYNELWLHWVWGMGPHTHNLE